MNQEPRLIGTMEAFCETLNIFETCYANVDMLALVIEALDGEPIGTLTVALPGVVLEPGEFTVKTWSENEPMRAPALATGLFVDTGKRIPQGFVEAEVWRRATVH